MGWMDLLVIVEGVEKRGELSNPYPFYYAPLSLHNQVHREIKTGLMTIADVYETLLPSRKGGGAADGCGGSDGLDIYGRVPPREPKYGFQCSACGRTVSNMKISC